jgi:ATP-dependent RNA helicase DDX24/MAK5
MQLSFQPLSEMTTSQDVHALQKMAKRLSLKRKLLSNSGSKQPKRRKTSSMEHKLDDLDWKEVQRPSAAGIDEAGGMLMLEEVDNVEVYYEETPKGKVAKFRQASFLCSGQYEHH